MCIRDRLIHCSSGEFRKNFFNRLDYSTIAVSYTHLIDGKAYTYILDENYIVVSNDRTYTLEDDDKYGEVLIYNNDIVAFRDKDKAELRVEEKKTETPDSVYDDVEQLIEDLQ